MEIRRLTALPSGADVWARARFAVSPAPSPLWETEDGTLAWVRRHGTPWLEAWGPSAGALVLALRATDPTLPTGVTLPRPSTVTGALDGMWDWRWTSTEPPPPSRPVSWMSTGPELAEVMELLEHSPRPSTYPGDPAGRRWCGVRDTDGRLVGCAADISLSSSFGLIGSITTHTDARGQGIAFDVTSWLTRRMLAEGAGAVGLGVYADNDLANRLYTRLGFAFEHRFVSLDLATATDAGEAPAGET